MSSGPHRYFVLNKPFGMVSQFVSPDDVPLLGGLPFVFPEGTHAVGRLDKNSEGLLILTTNKKVTGLLFQGSNPHVRTYLVQVAGVVSEETLSRLRNGITLKIKGGVLWRSSPSKAEIVREPDYLFTPAELKSYPPHTWLQLSLTEGKYHQVRKMVAAVHHKCRRLIRVSIEDLKLQNLAPGCIREVEEDDFFKQLNISNWES